MTLGQKQRKFTLMVSMLISYAYLNGYELTFGDAFAKDGHKDGSFHYKRLAVDLNLFIDGVYQKTTRAHKPLGEYWQSIGGTWGGNFGKIGKDGIVTGVDGNHYSFGE